MNKTQAKAIILETVRVIPSVLPYLSERTRAALKAGYIEGGVPEINARYNNEIVAAMTTYFEGGAMTAPRNQFRQAMTEAFNSAMDTGWIDGGQELPLNDDAAAWLQGEIESENGNISSLFEQAKQLRNEPDYDFFTWITARADGYTSTVKAIYNAAVMWAKGNQLLEWHLGNTEKHCETCASLDGTRHRASWYIGNNYIPRKPGADMECGGYRCDCRITDKAGDEITL
jgi:hypothetical protein